MKPAGAPPFNIPDRYKYLGKSHAGGQGAVYVCRDANLDRDVAVKSLHTVSKPQSLVKEIESRALIRSKHVVEIYDVVFDKKGVPIALILEFVPGESLQNPSLLPADASAKTFLLYQLACGIRDIHAANVIHRDIKPANVKVDSAGVLKIFDLGIANVDASNASTIGGAGTHVFRAPELYQTMPVSVTCAADVYALGVTAWHIFAGAYPPALLEHPPQSSGLIVPSLSTVASSFEAAPILDKCMSVDPNGRPTAQQVVDVLLRQLTKGKRRGVFVLGGTAYELSKAGNSAHLRVGAYGELKVGYDGFDFVVREIVGSVYVNNIPATVGGNLPDSCVLTFVSTTGGREFVPFNVSQPQIVV
jgi:eukaryotic-like serine/threonine-protein kinase